MKRICRELQERLALEGAQAFRQDEAARRHLEGCDACVQALEGLARLDEALSTLSAADAPEPVVSRLLERVAAEPGADAEPGERGIVAALSRWPRARRPLLWGLASAASVAFVAFLMIPSLLRARISPARGVTLELSRSAGEGDRVGERERTREGSTATSGEQAWFTDGELSKEAEEQLRALAYMKSKDEMAAKSMPQAAPTEEPPPALPGPASEPAQGADSEAEKQAPRGAYLHDKEEDAVRWRRQAPVEPGKARPNTGEDEGVVEGVSGGVEGGVAGGAVGGVVGGLAQDTVGAKAVRVGGAIKEPKLLRRVEPLAPAGTRKDAPKRAVILEIVIGPGGRVTEARVVRGVAGFDQAALAAVKQWVYAPTIVNGVPVPVTLTVTMLVPGGDPKGGSSDAGPGPARAFLQERGTTEGVVFQDAGGYWRNTYLPGDTRLRLLQARLGAWDRTVLAMPPHDGAAPPAQPFDAPRNAALAVYVHADRAGLDGPERMLVQVGLRGSARIGGARPAMNVGVVLDLRGEVPADVAAGMRALAVAFSEARQAGDRFHLIAAGRPGGVAVAPAAFKYGPVTVALDRLLAGETTGEDLDLSAAVATAFEAVCGGGDTDAPFGTSSVIVVTGQTLGSTAGALTDFAHQGAVAGIALSAVGVGRDLVLPELSALALAGQGRRRVLEGASEATRLVDEELHAASSAVARAVRLRIRLAPGVRLVDVIGSQRLDAREAERVREAEQSLDLRLARHLGIETDRGDDEDGIQIVIPVFHAADAHVILLDVVAPGPGAVADVSVRYKDVAFLRNGVARASLSVPAGDVAAGPLERNVLKNLLAFHLSTALEAAGDAVGAGDAAGAASRLAETRVFLAAMGARVPGLGRDADIARDLAMLDGYARLLANAVLPPAHRALVADSLRYAGRLKLLRRHV